MHIGRISLCCRRSGLGRGRECLISLSLARSLCRRGSGLDSAMVGWADFSYLTVQVVGCFNNIAIFFVLADVSIDY
jgi:hypothetical protein